MTMQEWQQPLPNHEDSRYPEDGFTTNTPSEDGYWLTDRGLKRVKKASIRSGIKWDRVASDPEEALIFVEMVEWDAEKLNDMGVNHDDIR